MLGSKKGYLGWDKVSYRQLIFSVINCMKSKQQIHISPETENLIRQHIQQSKSLKKTADHFGLSPFIIKRITGWGLSDYLAYVKGEAAKKNPEDQKRIKYEKDLAYLRTPVGREKRNKRQNQWKRKHCIKRMVWNANIAAKQYDQTHSLTFQQVWGVAKKQRLICVKTGRKLTPDNISLDHIVPLARGGLNVIENVQLIVCAVNVMKRAMLEDEFMSIIRELYDYDKQKNLPFSGQV